MNDPSTTLLEDDRIREELVAYLDGELDGEDSLRVERRLAEDAAYRQALQELEKAWDLLDALPHAHPDEDFTRTTVEMVVLSARQDIEQVKTHARRRQWISLLTLAVLALVAALAGFGGVYWTSTRPNRELVRDLPMRDLPIIENMEYYRHADSLEFLRRLESEGLFQEEVSNASSP
jgi:anti-sigma factor RsiW